MRARLRLVFLALLAAVAAGLGTPAPPRAAETADVVVLLHGLGRGAWSMKRIEWALQDAGYRVVNFGYPSRDFTVETLADDVLAPMLAGLARAPGARIHFVTHSMGGIVVRCYLRDHRLDDLGRIVMIAPPNGGSEVADTLKSTWIYRVVQGPAGQQLGTDGIGATLGPAPAETGIIAGDFPLNPLFSSWIGGPNDGTVSVASTRLEGMRDFLVLPYGHTTLLWHRAVVDQVLVFLREGRFDHRS